MVEYRRLQQYAIAISVISVIYNGLEGGVSIGFGAESNSRALIFFGIQSGIEVISALLVVWRFRKIARPGEERSVVLDTKDLRFEKFGTLGIGLLLIALALGTAASAIAVLALHQEPDVSNASLIISASALFCMILIWLPKRYLATALNSSTMRGEAICSLSCIQLTCVLFIGSLIFKVWRGGWWVDGATSMVLSLLFGWEGYKMVKWAGSKEFTGGCCDDCRIVTTGAKDLEKGNITDGKSDEVSLKKDSCCSGDEKDCVGCCEGDNDVGHPSSTSEEIIRGHPIIKADKCEDTCCSDDNSIKPANVMDTQEVGANRITMETAAQATTGSSKAKDTKGSGCTCCA